jgi:hypothetical protein
MGFPLHFRQKLQTLLAINHTNEKPLTRQQERHLLKLQMPTHSASRAALAAAFEMYKNDEQSTNNEGITRTTVVPDLTITHLESNHVSTWCDPSSSGAEPISCVTVATMGALWQSN